MTKRILVVLTSHKTMPDGNRPTGVWLEELTTPYYQFLDAGFEVVLASPQGGQVPVDPHSTDESAKSISRFFADTAAMALLSGSKRLSDVSVAGFDAIFLPGGHGTMFDLPGDESLATLLSEAWKQGKVLAAVCHGPAGLLGAIDQEGRPLVEGRRVSAFSNEEEDAAGLTDQMPFLLESRIRELGGLYEGTPAFTPFAVREGRLVTGQNPQSSEKVASLVIEALSETL